MRKKLSRFITFLIGSDLIFHSGWGLINPIFAIFIIQNVPGGKIEMAGLLVATYWIVKSAVQPFFANFFDLNLGERDDFAFLIRGMFAVSFIPLGYLLVNQLWQLFVLQALYGVAMGIVVPSWYGMFTRHLKKGWEAFSWSIQSTSLGFASGFAAAFGSVIAGSLGFNAVFVVASLLSLLSTFLLLPLRNQLQQPEL
jgi:predicted MFS family arabinose efflux permease